MKKSIKTISLSLVCLLLFTVLVSCAPTDTPSSNPTVQPGDATKAPDDATPVPQIDISEEVAIKYVHIGGETPFEQEVLDALNVELKEKINATVSVEYLSWGDAWTKAPLMFATQEEFDFIFCAPWFLFNEEGKKGAYKPLNDLLPVYAPDVWNNCPQEGWEQSTIDGEILMIPAYLQKSMVFWGITYREDLRKKYNVPEIQKFTDFEAYFAAIKANEPDMIPMNVSAAEAGNLSWMYQMENTNLQIEGLDTSSMPFGYDINDPQSKLVPLTFDPTYDEWVTIAKRWADAGYWSQNALANETRSDEAFATMTSAAATHNSYTYGSLYSRMKEKDPTAELRFYQVLTKDKKAARRPYNANGVAISSNSKNPERTLMFINLYLYDEDINRIANFGIEDVTYTKSPEGLYLERTDLAPEQRYGFGHMFGMGMANPGFDPIDISKWPQDYLEKYDNPDWQEQFLVTPLITGLAFDTEPVKTEIANIVQADSAYSGVLTLGLGPDPSATLEEYRNELRLAGIEKLQAELQGQIDEFLASQN